MLQPSTTIQRRRALRYWIPVVVWAGLITFFSTGNFSAEHTGVILQWIVRTIWGPVSNKEFEVIHYFVRKAAHFFNYAFFSLLLFRAFRGTFPKPFAWRARWAAMSLAGCFLLAASDELHQVFVPGRTASPYDVLLDLTGAVFMQLIIVAWIPQRFRRPGEKLNGS